ncbi:anti-sigma regulatory factor (Ser/Thr protein kinase) [Nocardiopsis mwathae]|uniref:Anti-sigma regulatory factor (Ser/Thr protein kinase) n=1 Tax=Nocardiopsis mwathae TaxID=1472723 RepID=A0A7W9YJC6_9ACTN|nr:ATP-binding protein [Nocardiopsis mwathae]MBB6173203.1 anti-sigma regulatory factor (Ser/Thr protein kinase) [Nocardiopsis mwathae]
MFLQHDSQPNVTTVYLPGLRLAEVGVARDCVSGVLSGEAPGTRDTALLLTSELATNALIHGDTRNTAEPKTGRLAEARPFAVTVDIVTKEISILVTGAGAKRATPVIRRQREWNEAGRGLAWVEALSTAWGTYGDRVSRTVWFTLTRAPVPVTG